MMRPPELDSFLEPPARDGWWRRRLHGGCLGGAARKTMEVCCKVWKFGRSDPKKAVFAAKLGLALALTSLIMLYFNLPFPDLSKNSIWAILTVILIFEFSVGATFSKGVNRGFGTILAGGLALGFGELSKLSGDFEQVIVVTSIFIFGFVSSFLKLYPTMKPYEYGFRVFLITFCIIIMSGYKTREFLETTLHRFILIAIGAIVSLCVNIFICPIWAGEDLHNIIATNFFNVANSLEGCVNGYLQCVEYGRVSSKILTYQASDDPLYSGYRSALQSIAREETLLSFAVWEPPHGPYKMLNYPWESYVKVSGALRHCAFMVMALHGCILSEIQAPPERRQVFREELLRTGIEGAKVVQELGNRIKTMTKLASNNILFKVHESAAELQSKIDRRSYLLVNSENWEIGKKPETTESSDTENKQLVFKSLSENVLVGSLNLSEKSSPHGNQKSWPIIRSFNISEMPDDSSSKTYESASALSLATFASLLNEFVARLRNLVDAFEELSEKAEFKECVDEPSVEISAPWFLIRITRKVFGLKC